VSVDQDDWRERQVTRHAGAAQRNERHASQTQDSVCESRPSASIIERAVFLTRRAIRNWRACRCWVWPFEQALQLRGVLKAQAPHEPSSQAGGDRAFRETTLPTRRGSRSHLPSAALR